MRAPIASCARHLMSCSPGGPRVRAIRSPTVRPTTARPSSSRPGAWNAIGRGPNGYRVLSRDHSSNVACLAVLTGQLSVQYPTLARLVAAPPGPEPSTRAAERRQHQRRIKQDGRVAVVVGYAAGLKI